MEKQYIHQYLHHIEYLYMSVDTYNDIAHHLNYNKLHFDDMVMNHKDFVQHIIHPNLQLENENIEFFFLENIYVHTSFKIGFTFTMK